jgi:hypothetical protein
MILTSTGPEEEEALVKLRQIERERDETDEKMNEYSRTWL